MRDTVAKHLDHDPEFEWRGQSVTRIENLSDIVFALALGMLLLTGSPPQNYQELVSFLINIIPVTAGFAILVMIWNAHFVFFRRYAIADNTVVFINSALLLLVLFIAFPLRFIFEGLFGFIYGSATGDYSRLAETDMGIVNSANSMAFFAVGYAIIFFLLSLLYGHALRKADDIGLDEDERRLTKRAVYGYRGEIIIALLVVVCALFTPIGPFAGALMCLNWPMAIIVKQMFKKKNSPETD